MTILSGDSLGRELNPDGRLRLQVELVLRKSQQQVCLSHPAIAHQHDFKEEIVLLSLSVAASPLPTPLLTRTFHFSYKL